MSENDIIKAIVIARQKDILLKSSIEEITKHTIYNLALKEVLEDLQFYFDNNLSNEHIEFLTNLLGEN